MIEFKSVFVQTQTWKILPDLTCVNHVILSDAEGKEVYRFTDVPDGRILDISNLPPGIYSIKIYNDNVEPTFLKIVKQ
jgi:hypothetical protein